METWIITADQNIQLTAEETPFFADAFDGFELDLNASKSRHPISKDSRKSDHISLDPESLRLRGCIGSQAFAKGVDLFQGEGNRTEAALQLLRDVWRSKLCSTVVVKGIRFENMALMSAPIRCTIDGQLSFNLEFEQFEFYDVSEVFEATIGRRIDLGEVDAPEIEATPLPVGATQPPSVDPDLQGFDPLCQFASQTTCLDEYYSGFF